MDRYSRNKLNVQLLLIDQDIVNEELLSLIEHLREQNLLTTYLHKKAYLQSLKMLLSKSDRNKAILLKLYKDNIND